MNEKETRLLKEIRKKTEDVGRITRQIRRLTEELEQALGEVVDPPLDLGEYRAKKI